MEEATLDGVALETDGQVTDWLEVEESPRVKLTFIPSGLWASILARQNACIKGRTLLRERIEAADSDDLSRDLDRLGKLEQQMLLIACEVVGRSLREVEGREPLRMNCEALLENEVESLIADGLFWPCYNAVMAAHWTDPDAIRALFRRRMG